MATPIRVLVVDDSAFERYAIAKHLEADPDITVVGSARDGLDALTKIQSLMPDVITLDIEMPRMDGLAALKHIMAECPTPVIMLSSLTQPGTHTTIQALMLGAVDFVPKPSTSISIYNVLKDLSAKIKMVVGTKRSVERIRATPPIAEPTASLHSGKTGLSPFQKGDPVIVIGTSTGGPRALQQVLADLPANLPAAVLIVQHMPPGFTRSLAQRLNEHSPLTVQEAQDGDRLARGLALLAPGDFHLRFKGDRQVTLDQSPRRQHVRPAVDVTMESACEYRHAAVIGVVLTGMGADGTAGAACIKAAGGRIIAEDETTSLIYGMPRSIIEAGLADRIVPLPKVASTLVELVSYGSSRI
jgi:two-component system, chemotaxis family, protein-glutamate methylesterase/glutaminase